MNDNIIRYAIYTGSLETIKKNQFHVAPSLTVEEQSKCNRDGGIPKKK